jgi:hypothetical protein
MKKLFAFILVLLMCGYSFGQNISTVSTSGDDNTADVTQTGQNTSNILQITNSSDADVIQDGVGNVVDLDQKGSWPAGSKSLDELAYIQQLGNNNQAQLWQLADQNTGSNEGNQYQDGNNNKLIAMQHTINANLDQDQIGNNNEAHSYQVGLNGYVKQYQEGIQNIAAVDEQGGGGWVVGNSATQIQDGNWNKSQISQYGDGGLKSAQGNTANISQYGSDNWAGEGLFNNGLFGIYQEGDYNTANVTQNDNVNWSKVLQYGDGNIVNVTQNGGTGLFNTYGDYVNKSTITQTGDNNNSTVSQTYVP